jgi:penicillin-binding protein 1A
MEAVTTAVMAVIIFIGSLVFPDLPDAAKMNDLQLISASQVYDKDGNLISKLFEQNRLVVPSSKMSPYLEKAIVANEDARFYRHYGIDPIGIGRAMLQNIKSGSIAEGGSTVTQQLAREMFLSQEQTLTRKLKEAVLAVTLESRFSKAEIMEAYLNQVYLGEGAYGVEAAAQKYFGKTAAELDIAESALIAGLARGPVLYSPFRDMESALKRRAAVLDNMYAKGYITAEEKAAANDAAIKLAPKTVRARASYFIDYVAGRLVEKFGEDMVYRHGLKIYTTLDMKKQQAAEGVLGDVQGAIVALDPKNGHILALVGGNNYEESQRNRVLEEYRQPGSSFKPFVYAAALQNGWRANSTVVDEPVNIGGYKPQNYDNKYLGQMTIKKALRWSVNTVAVKTANSVGIDKSLTLAEAAGIGTISADDSHLAAALGGFSKGMNLLELTASYAIFANGGIWSEPVSILKVVDEHENVIYEEKTMQRAVLDEATAYIMTNMLSGVLEGGTAANARLDRPAAGKTGTSDDYETAWFIGYTPSLLAGIYLGDDDRKSIGLSGTQAAGRWKVFMTKALQGEKSESFKVPSNIVDNVKVDAKTGKLAGRDCKDFEYSAFLKGTEPKEESIISKIMPKAEDNKSKKTETPNGREKKWWEKVLGK